MTPFTIFLVGLAIYLMIGFAITVIVGSKGAFDYKPEISQFKPGTFKYMVLFFWFVMAVIMLTGIIIDLPGQLNDKYNDLVKVRRF
jgi:cytochrome b subunit of formate dehydrogenase